MEIYLLKMSFLPPIHNLDTRYPISESAQTGWIKISLAEDFFHDNEYFFTYGNQALLQSRSTV